MPKLPHPLSCRAALPAAMALLLAACSDTVPTAPPRQLHTSAPATKGPSRTVAAWSGGAFLVSPTGLDFGDAQVGTTSAAQQVTVTNVSAAPVVVSMAGGAAGVYGGVQDCQGQTLGPGASCHISYAFAPTSAGDATASTGGTLNGQAYEIDFTGRGVGPRFRVTGTSLDFGDVPVGTSVQQSIDVTNVGLAPATVSMAGGAAGDFGGFQNCQGQTLAVGASCQITYTFAPTAAGVVTGSTGGSINGQSFAFTFRGRGVAPSFRVTPTDFDFGEVVVGQSLAQEVTVTNTSTVPVTVSMAGGAAGAFGGFQNCQGQTLAVGASCQITYTFAPSAPGLVTGSTGGSINGQSFAFSFTGTGIASEGDRTKQFRIAHTGLDFGNEQTGTSQQQSIDVTNVGASSVVISMAGGAAGTFGGVQNCQGQTLAPGASCQITYSFAPTSAGAATGSTGGSINGQSFAFAFKGNAVDPSFRVSPTALDFGPQTVGTSQSQSVTVTNVGTDPAVISMAGGAAGAFGGVQNCQGQTLAVGASCQITYTFAPTAAGVLTGSTGGSINGQSFSFAFRGEGLAPHFRITPFSFDFGPVAVGATQSLSVTVANDGVAPATISMAGGAAADFGGVQNCQGQTLAIGGSCQITYTFAPTAPGLVTGTTGGSIDGQPFAFTMYGTGSGALFSFVGFSGPVVNKKFFQAGSSVTVNAIFANGDGSPLSASDAAAIAAACRVRVTFSGAPARYSCAAYSAADGTFSASLKLDRSLAGGSYTVTASLLSTQGSIAARGSTAIVVR